MRIEHRRIGRRTTIHDRAPNIQPIEPGDSAQAAGNRRPGPAAGFQVASEAFDVGTARLEQAQVLLLAPAGVLAQVQGIRLAGQAGITRQKPRQGEALGLCEHWLDSGDGGGRGRGGHGAPPGSG
jgi:hypothetical protein